MIAVSQVLGDSEEEGPAYQPSGVQAAGHYSRRAFSTERSPEDGPAGGSGTTSSMQPMQRNYTSEESPVGTPDAQGQSNWQTGPPKRPSPPVHSGLHSTPSLKLPL